MCPTKCANVISCGVGLKSYLSAGINSAAPTMFFENRATSVRNVSLTGLGDGEAVT